MIQRFVPSGPMTCSMQYQVFRNKNSTEEQFKVVDGLYKQIMSEDKELCDAAQKNLNAGIFVNGELHPRLEKGPLHFQQQVREAVEAHWKREQLSKKEIHPARQLLPKTALKSEGDIKFCEDVSACGASDSSDYEW